MRQQSGMCFGNAEVVNLDRYGIEDRIDELSAFVPSAPFCQLNPNP